MADMKKYRVTLSSGKSVVVEANSAMEAQEKALMGQASQVQQPQQSQSEQQPQQPAQQQPAEKQFDVTLANGMVVRVSAKDQLEAQRKAATISYRDENAGPEPSFGRYAGLAGRAVVEGIPEGIAGLPALAADVGYNIGAAGEYLIDKARGTPTTDNYMPFGMPVSRRLSEATSGLGDVLGLPQPQSDMERMAFSGVKGLTSAVSGLGTAGLAAKAPGVIGGVGRALSAGPKTQVLAGAAAPTATEYGLQKGMTPLQATMLGFGTGAIVPGAVAGMQTTGALFRPFRQGGRQAIVGQFLRDQATDPQAAIQNLVSSGQTGPRIAGSQPWSGVSSRDYGLMNVQRGVERMNAGEAAIARQASTKAQNEALLRAGMGVSEEEIKAARDVTRQSMDDMTYALFDSPEVAGRLASTQPVQDKIAQLKGGRTGTRTGVKSVIGFVQKELKEASNSDGTIDPGRLYSIRQNLADLRDGKYESPDLPGAKLAGGELRDVISIIDNELEYVAPGYAQMRAQARENAATIGSAEAGAKVYSRATSTGVPDLSGYSPISIPKLRSEFAAQSRNLNETQKAAIGAVLMDLEDGARLNTATLRGAGSDTMQNLSVANVIGSITGGADIPALQTLFRPFEFLAKKAEPEVQQILLNAMKDPAFAASLMRKATPGNMNYSASILNKLVAGVSSGARTAPQPTRSTEGRESTLRVNMPIDPYSLRKQMKNNPSPQFGNWLKTHFPGYVGEWKQMHGIQ